MNESIHTFYKQNSYIFYQHPNNYDNFFINMKHVSSYIFIKKLININIELHHFLNKTHIYWDNLQRILKKGSHIYENLYYINMKTLHNL